MQTTQPSFDKIQDDPSSWHGLLALGALSASLNPRSTQATLRFEHDMLHKKRLLLWQQVCGK